MHMGGVVADWNLYNKNEGSGWEAASVVVDKWAMPWVGS
jgi:hypothetical protein